MHAVRSHNPRDATALATRQLACFCDPCMECSWNRCTNKSHVQPWAYHLLQPLPDDKKHDDELSSDEGETNGYDGFTYEGHHDALSATLSIGDTFAVNPDPATNEEDADFYLVKCTCVRERVTKGYVDQWGNAIDQGSYVVQGLYYRQVDACMFALDDRQAPIHILSHLVRCIKIPMEPVSNNGKMCKMAPDIYESVYNSMPYGI